MLLACCLTGFLLLSGCGGESQEPDPVVVDYPIAYVKRPLPMQSVEGIQVLEDVDIRQSQLFQAGGDLYLRDRASPSAEERNLTRSVTRGEGDVRDVSVSYDGNKLLFSLRLPEIPNADQDEQPSWNIWEYDIQTGRMHRIITSDITAEEGQDRFPHYLPDGRIVFSSTRQRQAKARLLDEGKPQYPAIETSVNEAAMVLHVMKPDGTAIQQISFNKSHDFAPSVLSNGQIIYSRWDNFDGRNAISLYRMNPDGRALQLLYGVSSHETGSDGGLVQFMRPQEMPDGQILVILQPFDGNQGGGDLVLIDSDRFVENDQPTWSHQGLLGPAQFAVTSREITTDGTPSPGGHFNSAYPLRDGTNRLLVSWSPCRLLEAGSIVPCTDQRLADPAAFAAHPLYGIFIYNRDEGTQLPILTPQEGVIYSDLVVAQATDRPTILLDQTELAEEELGMLHIRSVYDMDGEDQATYSDGTPASVPILASSTAELRPARFLRILKKVTIPDREVLDFPATAYGRTRAFGMREVVGYVPIEEDGSVKVNVPANVPLTFSVLDADGRRTNQPHQYSLQFRPGELVECHGCHDPANNLPHGRLDALPPSVIFGNTLAEIRYPEGCDPRMDLLDDAGVELKYTDLETANPLSSDDCHDDWNGLCRSIIHYEAHIHPLWSLPRNKDALDVTCVDCHDRDDSGTIVVPAGQLELSNEPSLDEPDHLLAYRELLYPDNLLIVDVDDQDQDGNTTELVDKLVQATDADGNPRYALDLHGAPILDQPIMLPVPAPGPSMRAGSASQGYFLSLFDVGGTHAGYLSEAEKRLIAEWLDIGAQYYNNPFDAPQDN